MEKKENVFFQQKKQPNLFLFSCVPHSQFSFFSLAGVAATDFGCGGRGFFWMQIHWPGLRRVFVEKFNELGSTR
jgi:hypothetical protein